MWSKVDEMKAHSRPIKRRVPGAMSKTEEKFCEMLDEMERNGLIVQYMFEPIAFKLAERLHYTPDFFAVYSDPKLGCAFFEVKASAFHAGGQSNQMNSISKLKVAANKFKAFYFYKCYPKPQKEGGEWVIEPVKI